MMSFAIFTFLKHYCDWNMDDEMSGACRTQTNSYILVGKTKMNISVEYVVMAEIRIGGCMYGLLWTFEFQERSTLAWPTRRFSAYQERIYSTALFTRLKSRPSWSIKTFLFRRDQYNCEKWLWASSCLSDRPSVRFPACPHGYHWTDFRELCYFSIFRKSGYKIKISLKSDKNNGYFTWRHEYIYYNISLDFS